MAIVKKVRIDGGEYDRPTIEKKMCQIRQDKFILKALNANPGSIGDSGNGSQMCSLFQVLRSAVNQ